MQLIGKRCSWSLDRSCPEFYLVMWSDGTAHFNLTSQLKNPSKAKDLPEHGWNSSTSLQQNPCRLLVDSWKLLNLLQTVPRSLLYRTTLEERVCSRPNFCASLLSCICKRVAYALQYQIKCFYCLTENIFIYQQSLYQGFTLTSKTTCKFKKRTGVLFKLASHPVLNLQRICILVLLN